jgi:hypothetical protein
MPDIPEAQVRPGRVFAQIAGALFDIVVPIVAYYALRAGHVGQLWALILSGVPTTAYLLFTIARKRRVDALGVFVLVVIAASVGLSFITGSPRFLLAKEGVFTAVIGGAFYVSLFRARPLSFVIGRALLARVTRGAAIWDELWQRDAGFRRRWRISAIIWGTGMVLDAAVRVLMSYTMPVDQVPALTGTLSIATLVVLQGIDQVQLRRGGVFAQLIGPGRGRVSGSGAALEQDSPPPARPPAAP